MGDRRDRGGGHGCADRRAPPELAAPVALVAGPSRDLCDGSRSEEHTSELQSLMRISYAVFCLKKKKITTTHKQVHTHTYYKYHTVIDKTTSDITEINEIIFK